MSKKHHHTHAQEVAEEIPAQAAEETAEVAAEETAESAQVQQPDYYEKYVRLSADFENFRKRTEREKAAFLAYGKKDFVEKLLPAYEVLLREQKKMQQAPAQDAGTAQTKSLREGLNMVLGEFAKAFESEGIKKMDVVGKPYDPQTAEVIAVIPAKEEQDGIVLEEVQMGFYMDGKVLRPARVVVGKMQEAVAQ